MIKFFEAGKPKKSINTEAIERAIDALKEQMVEAVKENPDGVCVRVE
ncbi:MAG: hypothetical protein FWG66_01230 [Spirochaetes bacterium]|nr:hypothetical protein [Spirochaetota bacterium]